MSDPNENIIRINRSIRPGYADWMHLVIPEMDQLLPAEYDIRDLKKYLYFKQEHCCSNFDIREIYEYLRENDLLANCPGLADLETIKGKGVEFFEKHFLEKDEVVEQYSNSFYAWGSVFEERNSGRLSVPHIYMLGKHYKCDLLQISFRSLEEDTFSDWNIALFFHDPAEVLSNRQRGLLHRLKQLLNPPSKIIFRPA